MKSILVIFSLLISVTGMAKNRPYTEVISELNSSKCPVKKENIFLSKQEQKVIEQMSETKLYGRLALRYVVDCQGKKSYLYVDSHIVRTLNETVVVKINDKAIAGYEVASFNEPPEYKAPKKWLKQFYGKKAGKVLKAREDIDALTGATLTVGSSINTVNKVLAMHQVLSQEK